MSSILKVNQIRWNSIVLLGKVKRWLCLERCSQTETKKFKALTSMFSSRTEISSNSKEDDDIKNLLTRFKRLKKDYQCPLVEVYVQFYVSALPLFTNFNLFMQRSDPQGHNVHPMVKQLISKLVRRILKTEVLKEPIDNTAILDNEDNYLHLNEIFVWVFAKSLLDVMINEGDISERDQNKYFRAAQGFYKESLIYVINKLPVNEPF